MTLAASTMKTFDLCGDCDVSFHLLVPDKEAKTRFSVFPWREDHVASAQHLSQFPAAEMGTSERSSGGGKHRSGSVLRCHAHRLEFDQLLCCPAELCCVPLGIEVKFKNMVYPVLLAPNYIPELNEVTQTEDGEF